MVFVSPSDEVSVPALDELRAIVASAARAELVPRFAEAERSYKADGSIVTEADLAMQQRLVETLTARWPAYDVLAEEMPTAEQAALMADSHQGGGLWCLDPLDGTSNFAAGLPFFAVSLALLRDGAPVLGLVYDPIRDECFAAQRGVGAWLNDSPLGRRVPDLALARSIAAVDFKRLGPQMAVSLAADPPYSSQRSFGSVALDWCWLAAGRFHAYLHGRQRLWDYAAGWLILAEAGGHSQTLGGEPVCGGESTEGVAPRSAVAALDASLFDEWRTWLARHAGE